MKKHIMNLNSAPFEMIRSGAKTIELRLYDEKRQAVFAGDIITFINTENSDDTIDVKVEDLFIFRSFDELYRELPLLECGYTEEDVDSASPDDMEEYYSKEKQALYGVVGIKEPLIKSIIVPLSNGFSRGVIDACGFNQHFLKISVIG